MANTDDELWQQVLDAQAQVDEMKAAYDASIADAHRGVGQAFDTGPADRLAAAKLKLRLVQARWDARTAGG